MLKFAQTGRKQNYQLFYILYFTFCIFQRMLKFAQTERTRLLHEKQISPESRSRKKQRRKSSNEENKFALKDNNLEEGHEKTGVKQNKFGLKDSYIGKTGVKDNNIEKTGVKLLFEKFDTLKKADDDFNSFLEVVSKDIATKTERLKKVKVRSDFW